MAQRVRLPVWRNDPPDQRNYKFFSGSQVSIQKKTRDTRRKDSRLDRQKDDAIFVTCGRVIPTGENNPPREETRR